MALTLLCRIAATVAAVLMLLIRPSHALETEVIEPVLILRGPVVRGDAEKVHRLIEALYRRSSPVLITTVNLNSPGGDVRDAVTIGRLLRRLLITTSIHDSPGTKAECLSACVFIALGGIDTWVAFSEDGPNIGVHRPYFDQAYFAGLSRQDAQNRYEAMSSEVRAYLQEVKANSNLVERMFAVSSTEIYLLSRAEIAREIQREEPAFREWLLASCRNMSGPDHEKCLNYFKTKARWQAYRDLFGP